MKLTMTAPATKDIYSQEETIARDRLAILKKKLESNDICFHFEDFSNVHNSDRSANATQSNPSNRIV